jgi:hypothetical protein
MALNVWSNLTRAGIGIIAFVLTCRLVTGVLRITGPLACDLIGALCCSLSVLSWPMEQVVTYKTYEGNHNG